MWCKCVGVVLCGLLGLVGCASPPLGVALSASPWHDAAFDFRADLVTETSESLFALDADLVQSLRLGDAVGRSTELRLERLLSHLYGPSGSRLAYVSSKTTAAMDTWRSKEGNCLSLTILAYAAARQLGLNAHMQEVQVPVLVDRRSGWDFVNTHVNVLVPHEFKLMTHNGRYASSNFIIDFEPQAGSRSKGEKLTESEVLARFYNNRAAEYLAQKDTTRAYAYFRAAIQAHPQYATAYANLALLYAKQGWPRDAERLLLHALSLGKPSYAALAAMRDLLQSQGRSEEATQYDGLLARYREEDPYHWLGDGLQALNQGRNGDAVRALERAAELSTGFEDVHFYLGVAYWRNGQSEAASEQLAALTTINSKSASIAVLNKKLHASDAPVQGH